jgi:hypothetical protein
MNWYVSATAIAITCMLALACSNVSGLSQDPRATFSQIACLDRNGDHVLNDADAADESKVPDFNGDRSHDANDAAFLRGLSIPLDPAREAEACRTGSNDVPEYLVAHGYLSPSNVSCGGDKQPVLLVGVGGGVVNLKKKGDAAGIRATIDALQKKYDDQGVDTIGVIAGPAIAGGQNIHVAMEDWLTHAVQVYLDRYPCLRAVLVGHSHGAVTADVVAGHLEGQYASRIIEVVNVDRVDALYTGNTTIWPEQVRVYNIYETNDAELKGAARDAANVENYNANDEQAPENGDQGGDLKPVSHTTIDNSKSVRDRIVDDVMAHSK